MKTSMYVAFFFILFWGLENGCTSLDVMNGPEIIDPDTMTTHHPPSPPDTCFLGNLPGVYRILSDDMESTHTIQLYLDSTSFTSTGILGYGFWFPQAPFSGTFNGCKITVTPYENVERKFLNSPGGYERYYFESMSGKGEYFPEQDSFQFYIKYARTGATTLHFEGNIYFKKK